MEKEEIIKEFEKIRDIPYRIALSPEESSDDCLGKANRLFNVLKKYGYEVRYRICKIKWSTISLPKEIAALPHSDDCSHAYLEVNIEGEWKIIDPTWDKGLKNIFHVNEWDGKSDNELAIASLGYLSPEESINHIKNITTREAILSDLNESAEFYRALNNWLEKCRDSINYENK